MLKKPAAGEKILRFHNAISEFSYCKIVIPEVFSWFGNLFSEEANAAFGGPKGAIPPRSWAQALPLRSPPSAARGQRPPNAPCGPSGRAGGHRRGGIVASAALRAACGGALLPPCPPARGQSETLVHNTIRNTNLRPTCEICKRLSCIAMSCRCQ